MTDTSSQLFEAGTPPPEAKPHAITIALLVNNETIATVEVIAVPRIGELVIAPHIALPNQAHIGPRGIFGVAGVHHDLTMEKGSHRIHVHLHPVIEQGLVQRL